MRVFISWSGEPSRQVAEALHRWLRQVLQALRPWVSQHDIEKGARWSEEIAGVLAEVKAGIVCVTPDNLNEPWLLFEAGALAKTVERPLVCTFLVGLQNADLKQPLAGFQSTRATKDDTRKLIATLNRALGENALAERDVDVAFDMWWPSLESDLAKVNLGAQVARPKRDPQDLMEEILTAVRALSEEQHRLLTAAKKAQMWERSALLHVLNRRAARVEPEPASLINELMLRSLSSGEVEARTIGDLIHEIGEKQPPPEKDKEKK